MNKEDARKQSPVELHQRRKQVIRLHSKGLKVMQIVDLTGLSWGAVDVALKLHNQGGISALKPKTRGRKTGTNRAMGTDQESHIRKLICDKRPEQLKMKFALWTRVAVRALILEEFDIDVTERCVGNYLKRWGFTPQKPIKKAYEQQPKAVKKWLDDVYPGIARKAKSVGAEIHWGDETAVMNTDVRGRSYAPRGKTPVTYAVAGKREKFSMISTVTNQGKCRWMVIEGAFNSDRFIKFLEQLIKDSDRKIFLILDNLRVHHSKLVKEWLEKNKTKIEAFYLPSYSPELNPDERLNADLKHKITTSVPARTKAKLLETATSHMEHIASSPNRVKAYFRDPVVNYAA